MSTPYTGRVQFGSAEVTVSIADVDARHWVGEITVFGPDGASMRAR